MANILVLIVGQLGDTLVSLPALRAIREHFADASISLFRDDRIRGGVPIASIVSGMGLADEVIEYPNGVSRDGFFEHLDRLHEFAECLRSRRFKTLVYAGLHAPSASRTQELLRFFREIGISEFIGLPDPHPVQPRTKGNPLPQVERIGMELLNRLAKAGIPHPRDGDLRFDLNLGATEESCVRDWIAALPPDGGRRWIGIGVGSRKAANAWPRDRLENVVRRLVQEYALWPVVFGGKGDSGIGERLVREWGCGYIAAGVLGVRAAAHALSRCVLYIGNDSGTMHLAASAGVRCVVPFSARDFPGKWHPFGEGHAILRAWVSCEGCQLEACPHDNKCLRLISATNAYVKCREILGSPSASVAYMK